jgi:hypothetical protein
MFTKECLLYSLFVFKNAMLFIIFRYLDNIEVFCPNDICSNISFTPYPFGVVGAMSDFTNGVAFVCGGARNMYADCSVNSRGRTCARNADCITSLGGSMWCTGPKISECYVYSQYPDNKWTPSLVSLSTPRAYAASVKLRDGRIWVLGGAGSTNILKSTEFITAIDNKLFIRPGPDMDEPLMGHCAAVVTNSQVVVLGGFSSQINDYNPRVLFYDFNTGQWIYKSWMSPGARMDSSCLNVNVGGKRKVIFAGGWNNMALQDTAALNEIDYNWLFFNAAGTDPNPLPFPIRSSVIIERNSTSYLLGGIQCQAEGRPCNRTDKGKTLFMYCIKHSK